VLDLLISSNLEILPVEDVPFEFKLSRLKYEQLGNQSKLLHLTAGTFLSLSQFENHSRRQIFMFVLIDRYFFRSLSYSWYVLRIHKL